MSMKKVIFLSLLLSFSSFADSADISDLQQRLGSFNSMRAKFDQTVSAGEDQQKATGSMAVLRPNKFRWQTTQPNQQLILADGNIIWIYDEDLEQVTKQQQHTSNANNPAIFLSGKVEGIPDRFIVSRIAENEFRLIAKSEEDMFESIRLSFSGEKLSEMVVKTRLGQESKFVFSQVELNATLPDRLFIFKPPKGVDIIENR